MSRNSFYRDGYRAMLRVALVQGAVILLLIVIIIAMILTASEKRVYFATNIDGRIMPMQPIDKNFFNDDQVLTWVAKSAREVMQMDYMNYKTTLDKANSKFTLQGRADFNKALTDSRILEAIERNKLVSQLQPDGSPQIIDRGLNKNGAYSWYIRMPVSIIYDGEAPPQPAHGMRQVRVDRVDFLENPEGIAFAQWVIGTTGPVAR